MSHMYGSVTITVTGPQELLEKVSKLLHAFTIDENVADDLRVLADYWDQEVASAEPISAENNNKMVEINDFYEIIGVALMPFEHVADEIPELSVTISGDIADSITDEEEDFFVEHVAGGDGWKRDDWVFDAASI